MNWNKKLEKIMRTQYKESKKKKIENKIKSKTDMKQRVKSLIIFLPGILKGKNRENKGDSLYEGVMAEMFSRMM